MSSGRKVLVFALLGLSGCGFTPLYGGGAQSVSSKLDLVAVQNIPERTGQLLRMSLQTQMHADGTPVQELYALNVTFTIGINVIGIQEDTSATRNRFIANAQWSLTPIGNPGAPLTSGTATTQDAENVIDQQYFAATLEQNTINQQLADQIAAQITDQVAAYFETHPNS